MASPVKVDGQDDGEDDDDSQDEEQDPVLDDPVRDTETQELEGKLTPNKT